MVGWLKDRTGSFNAGIYGLASMVALAGVIALALPWVERSRRASA